MDTSITIEGFIKLVQDYAVGRMSDVARGAETPRLAALLVQKYGLGVLDAVAVMYDSNAVRDPVARAVDDAVARIDPLWRDHARERWAGRPADVVTFDIAAARPEDH